MNYAQTLIKWGLISGMIAVLGMLCFIGYLWGLGYHSPVWQSSQHATSITVVVNPAMSIDELAEHLAEQGLTISPALTILYIKIFAQFEKAKSGTYKFSAHDSLRAVVATIIAGNTTNELALRITIPEGYTLQQVAKRLMSLRANLADGAQLSVAQILAKMHNPQFIQSLGISSHVTQVTQVTTLEGYLYPETYEFYGETPTSTTVITRMTHQLMSLLDAEFYQGLKRHNISLHQAIIMASLIEKETALTDEKPLIAEVIWNRLRRNMTLGIDAALIYGIKNYQGDITFAHLKDHTNRYNTRIHKGLPPTPIGSPTISSLRAVINPSKLGYLYYVLIPQRGGRHHFSKTYRQHQLYVSRLVRTSTATP